LKEKTLYVVIAGCGAVGGRIAGHLSSMGHSVVVIDRDEKAFNNLPWEYSGFKIRGDVAEIENLKMAKLKNADAFLALTDDDNTNFMVTQVAKKIYNVPMVLARVNDPSNLKLFEEAGVLVVSPVILTVQFILSFFLGEDAERKRKV